MANKSSQFLQIKAPSSTLIVAVVVTIGVLSTVLAGALQYTRKEAVYGFINSQEGELRILAPTSGVFRSDLKSGAAVIKEQRIAFVDTLQLSAKEGSFTQIQKSSLQEKKDSFEREYAQGKQALDAQKLAIGEQIRRAKESLSQIEAEQKTRQELVSLEQGNYARQESLVRQNFVAQASLATFRAAELTRAAELQGVTRAVVAASEQVAVYQSDLSALNAKFASLVEQKNRDISTLNAASGQVSHEASTNIFAPISGRLSTVIASNGETVLAGQLVAKLTPGSGPVVATVILPATSNGRIKVGQRVMLRMGAFPFSTYGQVESEIASVEDTPLLSDEVPSLKENGVATGTVVYRAQARILAVPKNIGLSALRPGMQFEGAVDIERKSFLATFLWPLLKVFY